MQESWLENSILQKKKTRKREKDIGGYPETKKGITLKLLGVGVVNEEEEEEEEKKRYTYNRNRTWAKNEIG